MKENKDQKEYLEKSKNIRQLAALPPNELIDHLTTVHPNIDSTAPNLAPHVFSAATNAVQFLNSKLPSGGQELLQDRTTTPSIAQRNAWLDLHKTVSDPVSVLDHVSKGTLNSHHLEAMQTVYPDLHAEMIQKIMQHLGERSNREEQIPYSKRLSISKFIGQPLDSTMTPMAAQAILASASPNQGPAAQGAQGAPKRASAVELKQINQVSSLTQTPDQARAADKLKS